MYGRAVGKNLKVGNTGRSACRIVLLNHGDRTAYEIARLSNYSPQHINRCLKDLFRDGLVCYKVIPHRSGEKRLWAWGDGLIQEGYIHKDFQQELKF